jgi:ABC-type dipeptide/oligopeptide/nickel transport system ATPase component
VDFRYTEQEQVLHHFNLLIPAGQTVALVGHTGAGKSSLGKLVARFYEFQGGQLLIDDQDIRTFDLTSYRRRLGIVPQTPFLFSGTVADNIRYARPEASDEEVRAVAAQIGGGDWLDVLEAGLETDVGEEGAASRWGSASWWRWRACSCKTRRSSCSTRRRLRSIRSRRRRFRRGWTWCWPTARPSSSHTASPRSARADRIIVLRKGEIIEEGDHDTLMAAGGHYAELYNTYYRHQAPDYDPVAKNPVVIVSPSLVQSLRLFSYSKLSAIAPWESRTMTCGQEWPSFLTVILTCPASVVKPQLCASAVVGRTPDPITPIWRAPQPVVFSPSPPSKTAEVHSDI